ncbi:MAG TPA: hypothetical protein VF074_09660 [Pyrinomonadaceae bacterium]
MKSPTLRIWVLLVLGFVLMLTTHVSAKAPVIPNPVLYFVSSEPYKTGGKEFIRYRYNVFNKEAFPKELFAAAPALPPCGTNTKASRTWVGIYAQDGKRLNEFCALGSPNDLDSIWFSLDASAIPPSWIYIELNDRQTNTKYKSNLADTTN